MLCCTFHDSRTFLFPKRRNLFEQHIIDTIRENLYTDKVISLNLTAKHLQYNSDVLQVYITLFQEGLKPIRWGSKRNTLELSILRCIEKLKSYKNFSDFTVSNSEKCRILVEFITHEEPCDIGLLTQSGLGKNRFEIGIDGLKLSFKEKEYFYMPTDATVKSHLSLKDIFNFFAKKIGLQNYTNSIKKRIDILKLLDLQWHKTKSLAFISYGDTVLDLYRGIPILGQTNLDTYINASKKSIEWALKYQLDNGKFLYYYDGVKDSDIDHEHPNMITPTYYNMLRHSGGIIALLHLFKIDANPLYIEGVEKAIEYLKQETQYESFDGEKHAYIMCNSKAKLGGSGIALVALMMHYIATDKRDNAVLIESLVRHILSRIDNISGVEW